MGKEIEAKYSVAQLQPIRTILRETSEAEFLGTVVQTDTFFDMPNGEFFRRGSGLRLRVIEVEDDGGGLEDRPLITFKGPLRDSTMKVRTEIQTHLDDAEAAADLLRACGLRVVTTIQKRRCSFRWKGCQIELDELPLIGRFVEIEGPGEDAVQAVAGDLGLEGESIRDSYMQLLHEACQARGGDLTRITFSEYPANDQE
jgi:adenylate cyclase class 2